MAAELITLSEELHANGFGFSVGGLELIKKAFWDDA